MYLVDKVPLVIMPIEGRYFTKKRLNPRDKLIQSIFRTKLGKSIFTKMGNIKRNMFLWRTVKPNPK